MHRVELMSLPCFALPVPKETSSSAHPDKYDEKSPLLAGVENGGASTMSSHGNGDRERKRSRSGSDGEREDMAHSGTFQRSHKSHLSGISLGNNKLCEDIGTHCPCILNEGHFLF